MNMSFYVGALGANASQKKMDVISNNLANINNNGFKPKNAIFSELINYNLNDCRPEEPAPQWSEPTRSTEPLRLQRPDNRMITPSEQVMLSLS